MAVNKKPWSTQRHSWFWLGLLLLVSWTALSEGACHQYGHACLGAHGKKRSSYEPVLAVGGPPAWINSVDRPTVQASRLKTSPFYWPLSRMKFPLPYLKYGQNV